MSLGRALVAVAVVAGSLAWSTPSGPADAAPSAGIFVDPPVNVKVGTQNRDRLVITVTGSGFSGAAPGLDVALTPSGYVSSASSDAFIAMESVDAGHTSWTLKFVLDHDQIAELDPTRTYQILTMRGGHKDLFDISQTAQKAVDLDFDQLAQPAPRKSGRRRASSSPTPSTGAGSGAGSGTGSGTGSGAGTGTGSSSDGSTASGSGTSTGGSATKAPAAAPTKKPWEAPAEAPTARGLSLGDAKGFRAGDIVTASATGFKPHEGHIKVVVYSTPIVLSTSVRADAHGKATWSGRLPKDIEVGRHILTFQGSVNRGIEFLVEATPSDGECKDGGCSAAPSPAAVPAPSASSGESHKPLISSLTWTVIAIMVIIAAVAGGIALLVARRQSKDDWERYEPRGGYVPTEPAYQEPQRPRSPDSFAPPTQRSGPPPMPSERYRTQDSGHYPVPEQPAERWSPPPGR